MTTSNNTLDQSTRKVCLGVVAGPQGLGGAVKIRSYTAQPEDIASYGPVSDKNGNKSFHIHILRSTKKGLVAELSGVEDRAAAESIKGLELYVVRDALPDPDDGEFYFCDLIGLNVEKLDGEIIGKVKSMNNFGAGDVMEVELHDGGVLVLPFSHEAVPFVDVTGTRVVVNPPNEIDGDGFSEAGEGNL